MIGRKHKSMMMFMINFYVMLSGMSQETVSSSKKELPVLLELDNFSLEEEGMLDSFEIKNPPRILQWINKIGGYVVGRYLTVEQRIRMKVQTLLQRYYKRKKTPKEM